MRGGVCGLCLSPSSSPPHPALLHFKAHPQEGVPREAAARWRLCGRSLYNCQADGEELTLPTRLLPRPPEAWRTLNPLRASGAQPGRPSCLLTAATAGSSERGGRLPRSRAWGRVAGCPDGAAAGLGKRGGPVSADASCLQRGPGSGTPEDGVWDARGVHGESSVSRTRSLRSKGDPRSKVTWPGPERFP